MPDAGGRRAPYTGLYLPLASAALVATAISAMAIPATQALIAVAIGELHHGRLISSDAHGEVDAVRAWWFAGWVVGLVAMRGVLQVIATWRWARANAQAGNVRLDVVRARLGSNSGGGQGDDAASALERWIDGTLARQRLLGEVPAMGIAALLVIGWCAPLLALVAGTVWMLAAWFCQRTSRHHAMTVSAVDDVGRRWREFLRDEALGTRSVRGLRLESARRKALERLLSTWARLRARQQRGHDAGIMPLHVLLAVGQALIALTGALLVLRDDLDATGLIATLVVSTSFAIRLEQVPATMAQIAAGLVAVRRIEFPSTPTALASPALEPPLPAHLLLRLDVGESGAGGSACQGPLILHPGELVGLVGRTGDGVETLAAAWTGRLTPAGWSCRYGSEREGWQALADCSTATRSRLVQTVGRESRLLSGSVAANLRLGQSVLSDRDLHRALESAAVDDVIAALPDGLEQALGERGTRLSGGQRQRLCLARAIAARPRFLCLDQATSELDPDNEARVLTGLRAFVGDPGPGAGILLVTNSPVLLAGCDRVLVVAHGRVIAAGRDADLRRHCPFYAGLLGLAATPSVTVADAMVRELCA